MTGIERLECLAEKLGGYACNKEEFFGFLLAPKLREIAADITQEVSDRSGYESDVLAWVEKNGGLDAVKERTMPEDMSWPFYEDGEPVRIGGYWQQDGFDESVTYVDSISFAEDGVRLENEYHEVFYRYGERVKWPAPKAYDADGVEIRDGDTVWSVNTGMRYTVEKVTGESIRIELRSEIGTKVSLFPLQLTHERPVLDADGVPIKKGDTVWHKATGIKYRAFRFSAIENRVWGENDLGSFFLDCSQLTHERPDSFSLIEQDAELTPYDYAMKYGKPDGVSNGKFQRVDLVRRAKALAERERGE